MPHLGYECFGHCSLYFVNFIQLIGFGLLPIAYYIIFANLLRSLFNESSWVRNHSQNFIGSQWFSVLILAVLVFPLIIKKKIQELKIAGILLFSGVSLFIILMFILRVFDLTDVPDNSSEFYTFTFDKAFVSSLSTAFVAYGFQSAFFPIYNSLENKTYKRGMAFTFYGIGFCFIIYMCVMFISLYSFGIHIKGDVLLNVEEVTAWESYVLRGIFLLVISTHTPFIFFIGKESLLALIALCLISKEQKKIERNESAFIFPEDQAEEENDDKNSVSQETLNNTKNNNKFYVSMDMHQRSIRKLNLSQKIVSGSVDYNLSMALPFYKKTLKNTTFVGSTKNGKEVHAAHDILPNWIYYTVTLGLYAGVVAAACLIEEVEIVIKFIGSLANSTLNFTFPGLFYFIIMTRGNVPRPAWWKLALALGLAIYGTVMGLALTGINVWTTISPIKEVDN